MAAFAPDYILDGGYLAATGSSVLSTYTDYPYQACFHRIAQWDAASVPANGEQWSHGIGGVAHSAWQCPDGGNTAGVTNIDAGAGAYSLWFTAAAAENAALHIWFQGGSVAAGSTGSLTTPARVLEFVGDTGGSLTDARSTPFGMLRHRVASVVTAAPNDGDTWDTGLGARLVAAAWETAVLTDQAAPSIAAGVVTHNGSDTAQGRLHLWSPM